MTYFDSEIVQHLALGGGVGLLLGLLLGWLLGRGRPRPVAGKPAPLEPPAAIVATPADAPESHRQALVTLPGMTDAVATKLMAAGVADVGALWSHGQDDDALLALADAVQMEDFALRRWVAIADLGRVDGISTPLADALVRVGVRSTGALAQANPDRVQHKLAALNAGNGSASAPDRATVLSLIERAATL